MELLGVSEAGPALEEVRALFEEYWRSFGFTPCFQGFDAELSSLPGEYAPPRGALFLARQAGCVAVRSLDADTAEMKRLFVRPAARGHGLGRRLAMAAIEHARAGGSSRLVLDTIAGRMGEAGGPYRRCGFLRTRPPTATP